MNWDAIGAVGEMIGALTVLTLAYLALQIRACGVTPTRNRRPIPTSDRSDLAVRGVRQVYIERRAYLSSSFLLGAFVD